MKISILMESIAIPKFPKNYVLEIEDGATAGEVVKKLESEKLTGTYSTKKLLSSHALICNSAHINAGTVLKDGDCLMIIKSLIGG